MGHIWQLNFILIKNEASPKVNDDEISWFKNHWMLGHLGPTFDDSYDSFLFCILSKAEHSAPVRNLKLDKYLTNRVSFWDAVITKFGLIMANGGASELRLCYNWRF